MELALLRHSKKQSHPLSNVAKSEYFVVYQWMCDNSDAGRIFDKTILQYESLQMTASVPGLHPQGPYHQNKSESTSLHSVLSKVSFEGPIINFLKSQSRLIMRILQSVLATSLDL